MLPMKDSLPKLKTFVRILHSAAGANAVDIYASGNPLAMNISFGDITNYVELSPGKYNIQIYAAGTYDTPLYSEELEMVPTITETLCLSLLESSLSFFRLKDVSATSNDIKSYLRFINLSPNAPLLSLSLPNGDTLFNGVEYLETTGYYPLSAGIYNFEISATSASALHYFISDIDLEDGLFHTLYIIGLVDSQKPRLGSLFVQDGIKK